MRPEVLFPLFADVSQLPGVGPRMKPLIAKVAGGERVVDLLWLLPSGLIDRRYSPTIAEAPAGVVVTMQVTVGQHHRPPAARRGRIPYRITCFDETGTLDLVFFHARGDYLDKLLPEGRERVISGRLEIFNDRRQMPHPDHVVEPAERASVEGVEAVYPLTAGLGAKPLAKAVHAALARVRDLPEWLDSVLLRREVWPDWKAAILQAHAPESVSEMNPLAPHRSRLAYDELLANQLALLLVRRTLRRVKGRAFKGDGHLRSRMRAALPFELTPSQERASTEIADDMASDLRMLRLLQGDVGSGKTVVALLAMLNAVETGAQAVLMAPTEVLARQHFATIEPLARAAGQTVVLLTGREKGKARDEALAQLQSGQAGLAVGTHALFQEGVEFQDLGLAVIDEQHRFGVHQRMSLAGKGHAVDVLVMTATPIPRTLMLTAYGDMDGSKLLEKPAGRKPITTIAKPLAALDEVVKSLPRMFDKGGKVYWICPLVEDGETTELTSAEARAQHLQGLFGSRVGLVHGRMKGKEKDAAMAAFAEGGVDLLVATTVVEVGVDVPSATVIVIEHAERFGLAQLHQLRGRVGRNDAASTCILLYAAPLGETAKARIQILRETEDGFRIAEEDLKLRGAGELLGTRQSGLPETRLADLAVHGDLLAMARDDAKHILQTDPELQSPRGQALRVLLYLFERDAAIGYLRSG